MLRGTALAAILAIAFSLVGCGGGGGGSAPTPAPAPAPQAQNVQTITVDRGPSGNGVNIGYVSLTLCAPGTANCQTIDHVSVDTGSAGLRVIASVLTPSLAAALTQQTASSGQALVECTQFADGYVWGPVKLADLTISGEQAPSLPVQVIGDPAFPLAPADCSNTGPAVNTVAAFGANGIIGVGAFQQDCGSACANRLIPGTYYACPATGCVSVQAPVSLQVPNPVSLFAVDNNGVMIQLPEVPASGQASVSGSLIFGIGTQSNNAMAATATVLSVDPNSGFLATLYNGQTYSHSFVDSGSNAFFLPAGLAPACAGDFFPFLCPASPLGFSVAVQATSGGASAPVLFSVANAMSLGNGASALAAFDNLGAQNSDSASFDFGLPFFYGRSVVTAIENHATPRGVGPYVAF